MQAEDGSAVPTGRVVETIGKIVPQLSCAA
jgi:hypothetical protein